MLSYALCILSVVLSSKQQTYSIIYNQSNIHIVLCSTDTSEEAAEDGGRQSEHGKHVFLSSWSFILILKWALYYEFLSSYLVLFLQ